MDAQLRRDLAQLLSRGERIQAIKEHRRRTGSTLRGAKDAVDAMGVEPAPQRLDRAVPVSVPAPRGATLLRVKRHLWQSALSADESALATVARAAALAAAGAVPTGGDFCAEFIVQAVLATGKCEPRQALQVIYPDLATSSILFRPVPWSECTERICACATLQPEVWSDVVESPPRDAALALVQNALELVEQWLDMDSAQCFDYDHADVPGYDVF